MSLTVHSLVNVSLDAAGLVALADLSTISERTALMGNAWLTDALFLAPGLHMQQDASNVNGGDLPMTGAMTSGFVFRIENQATVYYLQRIGRPGHLVDARVHRVSRGNRIPGHPPLSLWLYGAGIALTVVCIVSLAVIGDYWAVSVIGMLVLARVLNVLVFRRRATAGWKGVPEPDKHGDLLVLLSQDRWVRLRGAVDDLKLVTSGQWVRDLETVEGFAVAAAKLLAYCAAALTPNASTVGSLFIVVLLLASAALLGLCNALTKDLHMFGCRVYATGRVKAYPRRLMMAEELMEEHGGRRDWAIGMGLIVPEAGDNRRKVVFAP
ncbi:hypothetical protein AURDEDRAFT_117804 [Auricularia subglabra TFB-10046 SS5]|uniref:Uncharacterized protein n=1 Tax=Auricularia subglabra (strain TFB-10046 / SS5) TaxID=717982 RepID=J0CU35_AURST|nr:hypothetical protein AURDEDRAFT_117804 [Auricularia subglabra TFB-10046 SS5]